MTSQAYVDLATLRDLCHLTAGQLYHYHPFSPALDTDQLTNDLRWNIVRPQVGPCHWHAAHESPTHDVIMESVEEETTLFGAQRQTT